MDVVVVGLDFGELLMDLFLVWFGYVWCGVDDGGDCEFFGG